MADLDIQGTSTADLSGVTDFITTNQVTDGVTDSGENVYDSPKFSEYYGAYKELPLLKKAIDAFATWVLGKGFETDAGTKITLDHISGRGDEDFLAVLWNMKVVAKINGDSFAEIIRDEKTKTLLNLKPLSPNNVRVVFNKGGRIVRYEDRRSKNREIKKRNMLHFSNDRVADEMGGTSVVPVVKDSIESRKEAMNDFRRLLHRSSIRIMYVDEDTPTRMANLKRDYKDAIKNGDLLLLPKGISEIPTDLSAPQTQHIEWIRYLENFIYVAVGIPKVIMGSVDSIPESGGKISYLTYEQIYTRETREMEADLWSQLAIRVKFIPPASIESGMNNEADKNVAQTGFQPNDTEAGVGK